MRYLILLATFGLLFCCPKATQAAQFDASIVHSCHARTKTKQAYHQCVEIETGSKFYAQFLASQRIKNFNEYATICVEDMHHQADWVFMTACLDAFIHNSEFPSGK